MRIQIHKYLIGLAYLCSSLLSEAAQAKAKNPTSHDVPSPTCPMVDDRSHEVLRSCTGLDLHTPAPSHQSPAQDIADKDPTPANDRKQASQADDTNGHFDAKGRTGLIPVGRMGWREIGSWREMHRVRSNRQVP